MMKRLLFLIIAITFLKGLVWSFFIPLWHFPDEQAHFAHVEYLAEGGESIGQGLNLSEEILLSEKILGTKRDGGGNNKFTYHPEFNIGYSDDSFGLREEEIKNVPLSTRKDFVGKEAAAYNSFFYKISGLVYKLFYYENLFVRVFVIRIFWLFSIVLMVYLSFLIAKEIFPSKVEYQLTVPLLVSFHPMFTFVSSGVSIDNILNLFFSGLICFSILLMAKPNLVNLSLLLTCFIFGSFTKHNFLVGLAIILVPVIFLVLYRRRLFLKLLFLLIFVLIIVKFREGLIYALVKSIFSGELPYFDYNVLPSLKNYSIWKHFGWTVRHTIKEVIPWYWGVFRWLSLVLPRWINRVLMRLLAAGLVGLLIKFLLAKNRRFNRQNLLLLFIFYTALVYFFALFVWDWCFFRAHGFSFGIQGRYYFPVIIPHIILLVVGLETFWALIVRIIRRVLKINKKIIRFSLFAFRFSLCLWFIFINSFAFFWVIGSYYDLSNFRKFIIQASQYKPWFAKGYYLVVLLAVYLLALLVFIFKLVRFCAISCHSEILCHPERSEGSP